MTELYFRRVNDTQNSPTQYRLWKFVSEGADDSLLVGLSCWIGEAVSAKEMAELAKKANRVTVEW